MNQYEINEFPTEVIAEIKWYVYRLIDPRNGETFYVGKGKANRVFEHIKCIQLPDDTDEINDKQLIIRQINAAGLNVIHVIHRHGMNEGTAFEVEAAIIDAFPEVTNLVGGVGSNDFGPMNAIEIVKKYAAEKAIMKHRVLMITINKTINERSIYDATRFAWKLSKDRLSDIQYVLAVVQGIIVGVFQPTEWREALINNFPEFNIDRPGRFGFIGIEADSVIKDMYLRKRIPDEFRKKGAANPIKYSF